MDFDQAKQTMELHASRYKKRPHLKNIANKTQLRRNIVSGLEDTSYSVLLFGNEILKFTPERVIIDDHDWVSHTTHARLNDLMPKGFRIWGATRRQIADHPLIFLRTPAGVFAAQFPMHMSYAGIPHGGNYATSRADLLVSLLPAYATQCMRWMLSGVTISEELPPTAEEEPLGWLIRNNRPTKVIIGRAAEQCMTPSVEATIRALLQAPKELRALLHPRTRRQLAEATEATLLEKLPLLDARTKRYIYTEGRKGILSYLVSALGFKSCSWNRR